MEKWGQQNRRERLSCSLQVLIPCSPWLSARAPISTLPPVHECLLMTLTWAEWRMLPTSLTQQSFPHNVPATKGENTKDRKWVEDGRTLATRPQAQPQIPPHTECGLSGKWVFVFHKDAEIWGCLLQYLAYPSLMLKAPESQPGNGWNKMFLKIGMIANKHVCATKEIKIHVE